MHRYLGSKRGKLFLLIGSGISIFTAIMVLTFAFENVGNDHSSSNVIANNPITAKEQKSDGQFESQCMQYLQEQDQSNSSSALSLPKIRDSNLRIDLVTGSLSNPTSMAFVDRCTILALQKNDGKVIMITNGTIQKIPVRQIRVENASERGLLGIAVSNDTAALAGKSVFLYLTENDHGDVRNRIYKYEWTGKNLTNEKLILDLPGTPGPNHDGGKMVIGKDGSLYAVIGDLNREGMLQNIRDGPPPDDTGVIFRVNPTDGSAAQGNPFLTSSSMSNNKTEERVGRYFAYGIRNSFGLAIDPITGNLWDTENGVDEYDELNLVLPGFNTGWQQVMGPLSRDDGASHNFVILPNSRYSDPVFSWKATVALTAIEFLDSARLGNKYANNIFVGDFLNGNLYFFKLNATRTGFELGGGLADGVVDNKDELSAITFATGFKGGITDVQTGPDGFLYVLTFGGDVYRIAPRSSM